MKKTRLQTATKKRRFYCGQRDESVYSFVVCRIIEKWDRLTMLSFPDSYTSFEDDVVDIILSTTSLDELFDVLYQVENTLAVNSKMVRIGGYSYSAPTIKSNVRNLIALHSVDPDNVGGGGGQRVIRGTRSLGG